MIEDIVVSVEKAKELRDAGYTQKTSEFWWNYVEASEDNLPGDWHLDIDGGNNFSYATKDSIAAPTSGDLFDNLPEGTKVTKINNGFWIEVKGMWLHKSGATLANALANMWLFLKNKKS